MADNNQPLEQLSNDLLEKFGFQTQTLKQAHENAMRVLISPPVDAKVSGNEQSLAELDRDLLDCDTDIELPDEEECQCGDCINCLRQDFGQQALEAFDQIFDDDAAGDEDSAYFDDDDDSYDEFGGEA